MRLILLRGGSHDRYYFNPRTPYGMRLDDDDFSYYLQKFQSTHPLRDATQKAVVVWTPKTISIHAPLTGCDEEKKVKRKWVKRFQSTHPLRDATQKAVVVWTPKTISIHAPLTGCDKTFIVLFSFYFGFQSTHPLRDATCRDYWQLFW